ncbi:predicted protein [Nematostella vectensis]|uniref:Guanine nucleotide-binding protein-like 1 n=1 Tax=Nematostella vectensis TaxID=45351 RepID=A7SBP5_NEMVE|nr:predicted protein [Nematostella vectensis]|eukprot:XP_001630940.1 predicted protein [Nematostella vectensis]
MSKEQVENNERKEFQKYLEEIYKHHKQSELSYFEHNLETWRQLWRVLEVSDIIVCLADIRHPALHFSPALYEYVLKDLKKKFILVLNKVDLVSPELVTAWKCYFQSKYEHLSVVCFSSFPKAESERNKEQGKVLSKKQRRKKFNSAVGPRELLAACSKLCGDKDEIDQVHEEVETNDALLTLGFVGHTNVGKSSLLNGLVGKKVVSVSRTPGHTKHFQTIFLTPSVRLCDCPGLVFPSLVDKQLQILSGLFPISQVQEPYTAVGYLAARWPLVHMLKLVLPQDLQEDDNKEVDHKWSAWDICEAWAERRGYMTAKAARRDVYRAANSILRLAVDGKVPMYHYPPGFVQERDKWKDHPDTLALAQVQDQKSESRRQREVDEEVSELRMRLKPHSLQPRDFMESADGDDEDETAEEGGLVSNNPFALLADE